MKVHFPRLSSLLVVSLCGLGIFALFSAVLADRKFELDDFPQASCDSVSASSGRTYYVDPQLGFAEGNGSLERPWHDLQFLISDGVLGDGKRQIAWTDKVLARLSIRPPIARITVRPSALIKSGDTVVLASGDYGEVDLSGIVNEGFVTIMAAPGAEVRFEALRVASASHFILRNIAITGSPAPGRADYLVDSYDPGQARADNLIFDQLLVSSGPGEAEERYSRSSGSLLNGMRLEGDCLTVRGSTLSGLESAISVVRGRDVSIDHNIISDITVDGIQFSGQKIAILRNVIINHVRSRNPLHPDCMQGQPQGNQVFGPVDIRYNVCINQFANASEGPISADNSEWFGFQGISIFDGRWRGIIIQCNLVVANMQHGISLYGVDDSRVEHNVVVGSPRGRLSWIAILPSKEGRVPTRGVVRGNRATAYLNAVQGAETSPDRMIDFIGVKRQDRPLMRVLMAQIAGVTLQSNTWLITPDQFATLPEDSRFEWQIMESLQSPASVDEALLRYQLPGACMS